ALEAADRIGDGDVLAFEARELLGDEEGLREKLLYLARARHRQLVVFGQFVDAENRDDVLQVLVALEDLLHLARDVVMLLADYPRIENARAGRQRIDGRVNAELRNGAREVRRRVEMRECCRGRR